MYHNGDRKLILIIDLFIAQGHKNSRKIKKKWNMLWKYLYSLAQIFMVSTKYIDPWILELIVSNITGKKRWGKLYFVVFLFSWFKWTTKSAKIKTPPLIIITQYQLTFKSESKFCLLYNCKKQKAVPKIIFSLWIFIYIMVLIAFHIH